MLQRSHFPCDSNSFLFSRFPFHYHVLCRFVVHVDGEDEAIFDWVQPPHLINQRVVYLHVAAYFLKGTFWRQNWVWDKVVSSGFKLDSLDKFFEGQLFCSLLLLHAIL